MKLLETKGCGTKYIHAVAASLRNAAGKIGKSIFQTSAGVRQGGNSSCPLFTFYVDPIIEAVGADGPDGWLGNLHILMEMDDSAILSTSRPRMQRKLELLKGCTDQLYMEFHPTKSEYIVVNATDKEPFVLGDITIGYTASYVYLGSYCSAEAVSVQVKAQVRRKTGHVMKYSSFLAKNNDAPYRVKKQVWESALQSAIFYSCETWLANDVRAAESVYMSTLKQLLGVRSTTCNDLAMTEAGVGTAKAYMKQRQCNFIHRLCRREHFWVSYIGKIVELAIECNCPSGRILQQLLAQGPKYDYIHGSRENIRSAITNSVSTRRVTYKTLNPTLASSAIYKYVNGSVPEYMRIAFTRMRLSAHNLRIETGRWARLPREDRVCDCGVSVQSEEHVLTECPLTLGFREKCPAITVGVALSDILNPSEEYSKSVAELCWDIFDKFK